jgi:hypothetical protein
LAEKLRTARRDAPPTYENLLDMAGAKIRLGRNPERALAEALGVSTKVIQNHKQLGRVPRVWFDKIGALPYADETRAEFDKATRRVVEILSEKDYSPEAIQDAFYRIRTCRAGLGQIQKIVHGQAGRLDADELKRMQRELFGVSEDAEHRFSIWESTHLRAPRIIPDPVRGLSPKQVEKLRARFTREIDFRRNDPAYKRAAIAAELIERPLRSSPRSEIADPVRLQSCVRRLFGEGSHRRDNHLLAQLTGLGDRHSLDLLKGANAVTDAWWIFLDQVQTRALGQNKIEAEPVPPQSAATPPTDGYRLKATPEDDTRSVNMTLGGGRE